MLRSWRPSLRVSKLRPLVWPSLWQVLQLYLRSSGSALFDACNKLRAKLAGLAGVEPDSARFADGRIEAAGQSRPLIDLVGPEGIDADGEIRPGATRNEFSQQSYGAHFAEVGVDIDTGEVRVRRMLGVFAAGRILNQKTARSRRSAA